jgi:hypothetical protein
MINTKKISLCQKQIAIKTQNEIKEKRNYKWKF